MLLRMAIQNFRSIARRVEFSMSPNTSLRTFHDHIVQFNKINVLKGAFIYGANAAGKTNIIKAVRFVKEMVVKGLENTETFNQYNRNDRTNATQPSIFEFDFVKNGIAYNYGLAIILNTQIIVGEWLCVIEPGKHDVKVFERDIEDIDIFDQNESTETINRLKAYKTDLKTMKPTLFLSEVARKKIESSSEIIRHINNAYQWFEDVVILTPSSKIGSFLPYMEENEKGQPYFELLRKFDTGVIGLSEEESSLEAFYHEVPNTSIANSILTDIRKDIGKSGEKEVKIGVRLPDGQFYFRIDEESEELKVTKLVCRHENTTALFSLSDESDGTNRLFDLIPMLFGMHSSETVYLVDELDRSLHPNLVIEFIKLFFQNTRGFDHQLIATTHQAELMDLQLLRRDEIWIVERMANGVSDLYSLDEFKVRYDKDVSHAYLQGRYGGVPLLAEDIFPKGISLADVDKTGAGLEGDET